MTPRRFPPPWSVEETDACFIVRDANGQALAYFYFEDESRSALGGSAGQVFGMGVAATAHMPKFRNKQRPEAPPSPLN